MVRGTVILPHGTGKTARVLVFATGAAAEAASAAGADEVGGDELIEKVAGGWLDFDAAVATPELMGQVGRLGKVLGPRGLMPNPKTGTVTPDAAKAVARSRAARSSSASTSTPTCTSSSARPRSRRSSSARTLRRARRGVRLKPSASKGRYLRKVTVLRPWARAWASTRRAPSPPKADSPQLLELSRQGRTR